MNNQRRNQLMGRRSIYILIVIYVAMIAVFAVASYNILAKNLKADLGNKAMILAMDITHWLDVDQVEYDRLLGMDFNDLLKDSTNVNFEKNARDVMHYAEIKYVYLRCPLKADKIKYKVEPGEEAFYKVPVGTPLSDVYLLDAVVNDETRLADTGGKGYTDKSRYTVPIPRIKAIMDKREPTYILETAEWGTYLCGFAPLYSKQGEFIGMLGVDLYPDKYYAYVQKTLGVFAIFFLVLFLTGVLLSKLVTRVWKAEERVRLEHELSAIDTLTQLFNRRRFLGLLEHEYAVCRREGMPLTIMLADLESFAQINSKSGDFKGDQVLIETAGYLSKQIKRGADGLCRFGGDEFGMFLHNTEAENARELAGQILRDAPHPLSLGILTIMPEAPLQADDLMTELEELLAQAKKAGTRKYAIQDETQ